MFRRVRRGARRREVGRGVVGGEEGRELRRRGEWSAGEEGFCRRALREVASA